MTSLQCTSLSAPSSRAFSVMSSVVTSSRSSRDSCFVTSLMTSPAARLSSVAAAWSVWGVISAGSASWSGGPSDQEGVVMMWYSQPAVVSILRRTDDVVVRVGRIQFCVVLNSHHVCISSHTWPNTNTIDSTLGSHEPASILSMLTTITVNICTWTGTTESVMFSFTGQANVLSAPVSDLSDTPVMPHAGNHSQFVHSELKIAKITTVLWQFFTNSQKCN